MTDTNSRRGKAVAIVTGTLSIAIALLYLLIVFFLDARGEMRPAPIGQILPNAVWLKAIHMFPGCLCQVFLG
ncbi:hypothetical protein KR51_00010410 [Rubidibacter lacunae KORDI 51-2]|uniref:Uncharacterized protein n=1 Tax=Rubidibacter lacunae KORDI 51-2 TaxID=582515 RepID=U5DCR0_9CHRO|nr:hypothetical protein [Rubidibacter lacunae]ERN42313.1 hypothetical protein KR51_00010410 [Rubidibacter lacunae KORDI 51-2]